MPKEAIETFYPASPQEWRQWLLENHQSKQCIWLIFYKKKSGRPSITWSEAVDQAICFGWIDSTARPIDEEKFMQYFCKRKPNSVWSKVNKGKVLRLINDGLMMQAGMDSIETAKRNGSWSILDEVEELIIPHDLEKEFSAHPGAADFFDSLSKSTRKSILQWLVMAKRQETRQNRMKEIAESAAQKLKPGPFR
ncbi:YdeI/OmpD-associated family protein [Salmonirosea aquatica]|uniref:Bacteriocin-protection protein n=1 Tax=Salmonirosea aquatica TaxID=2654236 RepID=A0A7C9BHV8_9BACT|nr:hypothetical protein [Cytophagaceae bacterium SJW1-29]